jgi:hypothetical protein
MQGRGRRWIGIVLVAGMVVSGGVAYGLGRTSVHGSPASCLDWATVKTPRSTSSSSWTNVPGMRVRALLAQNFAVTVSGSFEGSDIQLRVVDTFVGGTFPLEPGSTFSSASGGAGRAFSFTWVGTNPAEHQHTFQLQWRGTAGTAWTSTLRAGEMSVVYQGAPRPGNC